MKKQSVISILVAAFFVVAGAAIAGSGRATDSEIPAPPAIGASIDNFSLPDTDGKDHSLDSLKGKNGAVLIFISVQCPVSNAYNERMEKLAQDYKPRGINVIGINANNTEPADVVKAHASEKHLTFTILKDPGNKIADRLGAKATPEAYFIDASGKLVYHGRIDNSKEPAGINSNDLRDALDAALAGKPIAKPTANAFGCSIKRA
jgi:peroxiredoxin